MIVGLADACQHRGDLPHQADIGAAHRAVPAHGRNDVGRKKGQKRPDQIRAAAGVAAHGGVDADGDRHAHDRRREELAGAEVMGSDQRIVEFSQIVGRPETVLHRADAGVGTIDGKPHRDTLGNHLVGGGHPFHAAVIGHRPNPSRPDVLERREVQRFPAENDGFDLVQHADGYLSAPDSLRFRNGARML
ncbi:hypothetical protein D9M72_382520 [compost metagenome]